MGRGSFFRLSSSFVRGSASRAGAGFPAFFVFVARVVRLGIVGTGAVGLGLVCGRGRAGPSHAGVRDGSAGAASAGFALTGAFLVFPPAGAGRNSIGTGSRGGRGAVPLPSALLLSLRATRRVLAARSLDLLLTRALRLLPVLQRGRQERRTPLGGVPQQSPHVPEFGLRLRQCAQPFSSGFRLGKAGQGRSRQLEDRGEGLSTRGSAKVGLQSGR
mmetsp:Transcript_37273/g.111626  ORF Transcript_37273/g.111626 Transcript_37273/m.111626 type:complete len:216 (+) Transcript_37273:2063-2710(+)